MTVLPIRTVPDPVLRTAAAAVDGTSYAPNRLHRLVEDMFQTMDDVGGVGLAAPQVGVGLRIFTFSVDHERGYVINPVLSVMDELVDEPGEGCLSVPGLHYRLPRHRRAEVAGVDVEGRPVSYSGEGLLARCLQHEVDHLGGQLFVDRLAGEDRRDARRRLRDASYDSIAERVQSQRTRAVNSSFGVGGQR